MKHILTALLLTTTLALADDPDRIVYVFAEDLKDPDKVIAKSDTKTLMADQTQVQWDDMTKIMKVEGSTTNFFRAIDFPWQNTGKHVSKEDAETKVKDKLSEKHKCTVYATPDDWMAYLETQGYERIPVEEIPE